MNKRFLIIVSVMLLVGGAAVLCVRMQNNQDRIPAFTDQDFATAAGKRPGAAPELQAPQAIEASRRVRLAIGSLGLGNEQQNQNVADLVLAQLRSTTGLEMVERQALETVLKELRLSLSGLVRAKDAVRAGKLLRADWFLLGTPAMVNGTNVAVIRIVDARTGVMRNAAMIPRDGNAAQVASKMAAFLGESRQEAVAPKPKTFLAIGAFEDLSLNNRQAALPRELRSHLVTAYQNSGVAMLEREFVNLLLNELYLDLAGLTEEGGTNAPAMQSAYWLVDGYYQTYETAQFEVEMVLNVRRMFGWSQQFALREKPGEPLFRRTKESVDRALARDKAALAVTRVTELKSQIATGREVLKSVRNAMGANSLGDWLDYTGGMSATEVARHRRNIEEAIRAFETALLLDPTNRQARLHLGECLSTPFARRFDQARDLYRELIDAPVTDQCTGTAQSALSWSFRRFVSPDEKQRWYEAAASRAINQSALEFFQKEARAAAAEVTLQKVGTPEAEKVAEARLLRDISAWEEQTRSRGFVVDFDNTGLGKYVAAFGTNKALAASQLVALLPRLKAASTNLAPHILAGVVTFQVDTNAPIIAEFERSLELVSEAAPPCFGADYYIGLLASPVYRWAEERRLYRLAARLKEILLQNETRGRSMSVGDEDRIGLAYNFLRAESWQKALDLFQSYSNRPVVMGGSGLWGQAFTVVFPGKQAALCREKLGLPPITDPREFDLGKPCLHPHGPHPDYDTLTFLAASDGLWIGLNGDMLKVGFDLQTNFIAHVLPDSSAPIIALCDATSKLWIGTDGGGLVEMEKATQKTRSFTEKDGLLMDHISSLHLAGDTLWIGYGNEARGALGCLQLDSGRFTSFTPSLSSKPGIAQPPGRKVTGIHALPSGEVWCLNSSTLFRCRPSENVWERQPAKWTRCYAMDTERLVEGVSLAQVELTIEAKADGNFSTNQPARIKRLMTSEESVLFQMNLRTNGSGSRVSGTRAGALPEVGVLEMRTLPGGQSRRLLGGQKLPGPATTLTLHGRELWVGGTGFIALLDLDEGKIKRLAYVPARAVERIQIGGGWVWVQFDKHIYRVSELTLR